MPDVDHIIGLLLGTEEDWPRAFETLVSRLGPVTDNSGTKHRLDTSRITIEPFNLRDKPRQSLAIDRLATGYSPPPNGHKRLALIKAATFAKSAATLKEME